MTRTRGTMVRTLNFSGILPADHSPAWPYALATDANGRDQYVICSEGVGWPLTDDERFTVETWQGMSAGMFALTADEIRSAASAGTDTDLADFVRTFGDRLEMNYRRWFTIINHGR